MVGMTGITTADFRRTAGLFATGVSVVATAEGEQIHGMTASAVCSLSLEPLLMLVCINKEARLAGFLREASGFSINVLRHDQRALSVFFAGTWQAPNPPPFRFVPWEGGPRLEGCAAAIACEVHSVLEGGDHWIVVGRVVALHRGVEPIKPLLFYAGRYGQLDTGVQPEAPDLGWVERPVLAYYDPWRDEEP
jgi:flavin reductase (DIM6/NTAB) family NADH-FMN oxidoreductase RutF